MPVKWGLSSGPLPITTNEFRAALNWVVQTSHPSSDNYRNASFGLAISGGVDSMALAALSARLQINNLDNGPRFKAYVVDHGARHESKQEVEWLHEYLTSRLGLHTRILRLQWPDGVVPLQLPNFETQARILRYQALGRACHDDGIARILLGHHEDDQAETVMMGLMAHKRGTDLQGMKPSSQIPECWGIHGVHLSGILGPKYVRLSAQETQKTEPVMQFERGGIRIYRPLLHFSKARLVMTCQEQRIKWVTDKTNFDPTVTQRNAVRWLLAKGRLPMALRKPSLLAAAQRARERAQAAQERIEALFRMCQIRRLELRSGVVVVHLPPRLPLIENGDQGGQPDYVWSDVVGLIRWLTELVSPLEHVDLNVASSAAKLICEPGTESTLACMRPGGGDVTPFTAGGVMFTRLASPAGNAFDLMGFHSGTPGYANIWVLSRQPYSASRPIPSITYPPVLRSAHGHAEAGGGVTPKPELWQLFDGRFWIKVFNASSQPVTVRPLQEQDLVRLRKSLPPLSRAALNKLLRRVGPGKVRWTLPAIADANDEVFALPTLGWASGAADKSVKWEVRFKFVDVGRRHRQSSEAPQYRASDIEPDPS